MFMLSHDDIENLVNQALLEDVGTGDITAQLIPKDKTAHARVITREPMVLCGQAFVNEVFRQINPAIEVIWHAKDSEHVHKDALLFEVKGPARALLTGERSALNFLQMLSGTATTTWVWVQKLTGTTTKLLDTRKTIPLFRQAQKYAVRCGGGHNHRLGLFDAFLIKENHIMAAGSITDAVKAAKVIAPGKPIEVEVESLAQLDEAIQAGSNIIMLDNFDLDGISAAVKLNQGRSKLEVSGNVSLDNIAKIAATGVDFISVGALTKHVHAVDLSMRFVN
jgi:nicotinate-nucleotide pyrophosphorylase (carboxylating)